MLDVVKMTQAELDRLLEYSCSIPTGVTIGKRWKRDLYAYDQSKLHNPEPHSWVMGEYVENPKDPDTALIVWRRIDVTDLPAIDWLRCM